jgi:hypothetical protein
MLDLIDILIEVPCVDYEKLSADRVEESSKDMHARVQAARFVSQHFGENLPLGVYLRLGAQKENSNYYSATPAIITILIP